MSIRRGVAFGFLSARVSSCSAGWYSFCVGDKSSGGGLPLMRDSRLPLFHLKSLRREVRTAPAPVLAGMLGRLS